MRPRRPSFVGLEKCPLKKARCKFLHCSRLKCKFLVQRPQIISPENRTNRMQSELNSAAPYLTQCWVTPVHRNPPESTHARSGPTSASGLLPALNRLRHLSSEGPTREKGDAQLWIRRQCWYPPPCQRPPNCAARARAPRQRHLGRYGTTPIDMCQCICLVKRMVPGTKRYSHTGHHNSHFWKLFEFWGGSVCWVLLRLLGGHA